MDPELAPCRACGATVPPDATTCPACDYAVDDHHRPRLLLGAVGTALTLTVALAPVGLPLLWAAHRHRLAAAGTVTTTASPALGAHVGDVLRRHLRLEPERESYRGGPLPEPSERPAGHHP